MEGEVVLDVRVEQYAGLVRPAARHVPQGVPPAAQHQHGDVVGLGGAKNVRVYKGVSGRFVFSTSTGTL